MPFQVAGQISLPKECKDKLTIAKQKYTDDVTGKEPTWEEFFNYLLSLLEENPSS